MIQDSVYLVTGGASGLGQGTAEVLLSEGAYLAIIDLQLPAEDSILRAFGDRVLFLQVDVTLEKDVLNALDATKRKFGKLNGVINCAGAYIKGAIYDFKKNEPHSFQKFTKIINVNLIGTFNVTRLAVPLLLENEPNSDGERGVIINTSSLLGHHSSAGFLAYSASKAGTVALTHPLSKELSSHGIRVLDIAPGYMDTPMTDRNSPTNQSFPSEVFAFPKQKGKPSEFGNIVKRVIENPMLNGSSIKLKTIPHLVLV